MVDDIPVQPRESRGAMWLLPAVSPLSRAAGRVYYRLEVSGARVPRRGPVLLVANHPNMLLDSVLVAGTARRRVRFLAKAPFFFDPRISWFFRAAGAIPVYRRSDDPSRMDGNFEMFRAVHAALADGAAVGIFPEGISHGDPSLAPLRTGAARIALGAVPLLGQPFPIVPIGLIYRRKEVFRSGAAVIVGPEVEWAELAARGLEDTAAVRELTERISRGLHRVTLNLEQWADRPLAECAVGIWDAEIETAPDRAGNVARMEIATTLLARIRADADGRWDGLVQDLWAHLRRLRSLRLEPADLSADMSHRRGLGWSAGLTWLLLLPAAACALVGFLTFWPPYRVTGLIARLGRPDEQTRSTFQLLVGLVLYALWVILLAVAAGVFFGPLYGLALVPALPLIGVAGRVIREGWREALRDARRFFLLRSRRNAVSALRGRQRALGARLKQLHVAFYDRGAPA